jgi:SAM-dependent methyltransferase
MDLSKYQCVICQQSGLHADSNFWRCNSCGYQYPCINGIPRLYVESRLGQHDKKLRDYLYDGFLGSHYQQTMPFLSLPVRPIRTSWRAWLVYWFMVVALASLGILLVTLSFKANLRNPTVVQLSVLLLSLAVLFVLFRHRYLAYLLVLALPVKISILCKSFRPMQSFAEVHAEALQPFLQSKEKLQVLDISTGTCNSLYRHGWMQLNADYTGLDLSETMLLQGQKFMIENQVPMDFVLADASQLPFVPETFDIVLNYGAINGFTNPKRALEEMARVAKKGGLVFFLDEQLYEGASFVERLYFKKVLSSHNTIHRCPVESIPASLGNIRVHQVYQFYYICTCHKP